MTFKEALEAMKQGVPVKLPSWGGYWWWDEESQTILMYTKDGDCLDIRETQRVEYTIQNILSDDAIILAEPKNIIVVNTYAMKLRKDAASKDAIMQDKRFYVIHFDFDALIEETDATAIITGLPAYNFSA